MTVMIVDDSASIRNVIRSMLTATADVFCECEDGSEALNSYKKFHPDWVLMDIKMNTMDGFEATEEILSEYPDAKIVMITQYDDPKLQQKAQQIGVRGFVLKEKLLDIVRIMQSYGHC